MDGASRVGVRHLSAAIKYLEMGTKERGLSHQAKPWVSWGPPTPTPALLEPYLVVVNGPQAFIGVLVSPQLQVNP